MQLHAYSLMGNHYHLLNHTPKDSIGRAMRHINGMYTQRFNRLQCRDGPLFRGRYKAIVVDADSYHLSLSLHSPKPDRNAETTGGQAGGLSLVQLSRIPEPFQRTKLAVSRFSPTSLWDDGIGIADIGSLLSRACIWVARAVAMWLRQEYTDMTQPEIGQILGGYTIALSPRRCAESGQRYSPITAYMGLWKRYGRSCEFVVAAPAETTISG